MARPARTVAASAWPTTRLKKKASTKMAAIVKRMPTKRAGDTAWVTSFTTKNDEPHRSVQPKSIT